MQPNAGQLSQHEAEEYLANLQILAQELDRAMAAMAANALSDLEDSLIRQRATCTRLVDMQRGPVLPHAQGTGTALAPVKADLAARITAAATALNISSRQYSALLKHFGETVRVFAGVFRTYGGPAGRPLYIQNNLRTWSCEL